MTGRRGRGVEREAGVVLGVYGSSTVEGELVVVLNIAVWLDAVIRWFVIDMANTRTGQLTGGSEIEEVR